MGGILVLVVVGNIGLLGEMGKNGEVGVPDDIGRGLRRSAVDIDTLGGIGGRFVVWRRSDLRDGCRRYFWRGFRRDLRDGRGFRRDVRDSCGLCRDLHDGRGRRFALGLPAAPQEREACEGQCHDHRHDGNGNDQGFLFPAALRNGHGVQVALAQAVDALFEVFGGAGQSVLIAHVVDVPGQLFGEAEALEHHRHDVFVRAQRLGNLPTHPIALIVAAIQRMGREYQYKVGAGLDRVEQGFVELAGAQHLQVVEYVVSAILQRLVEVHGCHIAAFPAIADEHIAFANRLA